MIKVSRILAVASLFFLIITVAHLAGYEPSGNHDLDIAFIEILLVLIYIKEA